MLLRIYTHLEDIHGSKLFRRYFFMPENSPPLLPLLGTKCHPETDIVRLFVRINHVWEMCPVLQIRWLLFSTFCWVGPCGCLAVTVAVTVAGTVMVTEAVVPILGLLFKEINFTFLKDLRLLLPWIFHSWSKINLKKVKQTGKPLNRSFGSLQLQFGI